MGLRFGANVDNNCSITVLMLYSADKAMPAMLGCSEYCSQCSTRVLSDNNEDVTCMVKTEDRTLLRRFELDSCLEGSHSASTTLQKIFTKSISDCLYPKSTRILIPPQGFVLASSDKAPSLTPSPGVTRPARSPNAEGTKPCPRRTRRRRERTRRP